MQLDMKVRRLRYRLNRQGMLELDAWLAPLLNADMDDQELVSEIELLLSCEPPDLQAMMLGELPVPAGLGAFLSHDCER
jgi:succinate dehydrogenase flavin-adding protein (antitoxin of CptAB toxin-antitoxin module)